MTFASLGRGDRNDPDAVEFPCGGVVDSSALRFCRAGETAKQASNNAGIMMLKRFILFLVFDG
jgi:hypothetical protein